MYWIKEIDKEGRITSINWTDNYEKVREAAGYLAALSVT